MAESKLDLVRSIYAKWSVGDFSDGSWAAEDMEFVHVDGTSGRGPAFMAREWRDFLGAWDYLSVVPQEWGERGDDVLVLATAGGRSKRSGVAAADFFAGATRFTVRDGRVVALRLYPTAKEALEATGLERSQLKLVLS